MNACNYVGVTIDEHLSFGLRGKKSLQKMALGTKLIDTIKNQLSTTTRVMLLQSLFLKRLSYPARLLLSICTASFNSPES